MIEMTVPSGRDVPVGLAEIAATLGVTRQTADKWRTRGLLPAPAWTVGGRPAWPWGVIEDWARKTGRLTHPDCPDNMDSVGREHHREERIMSTGTITFGTVTDYAAGEAIRPATPAEWRRTADKLSSGDSDGYAGAWVDADGRSVFVDGGPDAEVTGDSIAALASEAGSAGDQEQAAMCARALAGDDGARAGCARVILDARMESAA